MRDLEEVDVLAQLGDVAETFFGVGLSRRASRTEDLPCGWTPVGIADVVAQVGFATAARQTAVVE